MCKQVCCATTLHCHNIKGVQSGMWWSPCGRLEHGREEHVCLYGHMAALGHNRYADMHKGVGLECIRHVDMCPRCLCPHLAS